MVNVSFLGRLLYNTRGPRRNCTGRACPFFVWNKKSSTEMLVGGKNYRLPNLQQLFQKEVRHVKKFSFFELHPCALCNPAVIFLLRSLYIGIYNFSFQFHLQKIAHLI
jgi:hypothetical protein